MKKIIFLLALAILQYVQAKPIIVTKPLYIDSNVQLHDATFVLAPHANCPVIIIGAPYNAVTTNVTISNIVIDGNADLQDRELYRHSSFGPINNDGLLIQNANGVIVSNVVIRNCRSGGMVTTCFVRNLKVDHLVSCDNFFDGLACYHTMDGEFNNITCNNNHSAGFSFDLQTDRNCFNNICLTNNSVGVFMRNSAFNNFTNLVITGCSSYELYLSMVDQDTNTTCAYNRFRKLHLEKNKISDVGNDHDSFK